MNADDRQLKLMEVAEKWDTDHKRLRDFESIIFKFENVPEKIDEILIILKGDLKSPGIIDDVRDLKAWRISSTTRVKSRVAWLWSVCGAVIVVVLDRITSLFHITKP